eukprot:gene7700-21702_t
MASAPSPPRAAPVAPMRRRRVGWDGAPRSLQEFIDHYGLDDAAAEWGRARPLPPPSPHTPPLPPSAPLRQSPPPPLAAAPPPHRPRSFCGLRSTASAASAAEGAGSTAWSDNGTSEVTSQHGDA